MSDFAAWPRCKCGRPTHTSRIRIEASAEVPTSWCEGHVRETESVRSFSAVVCSVECAIAALKQSAT